MQTSYRAYYPSSENLQETFRTIVQDYGLRVPFADLARDIDQVVRLLWQQMDESRLRANF